MSRKKELADEYKTIFKKHGVISGNDARRITEIVDEYMEIINAEAETET